MDLSGFRMRVCIGVIATICKSPNLIFWCGKLCGNAQQVFGDESPVNCAFPQNLHTRKLGEILVFHAVVYNAHLLWNSLTFTEQ